MIETARIDTPRTAGFRRIAILGLVTIALSGAVAAASAQTRVIPPRVGAPSGPSDALPAVPPKTPQPGEAQPGEGTSAPGEDLSRSGGVIQPPAATDPGMTRPAPSTGSHSMPVIPPPEGSGSAPLVPK